MGPPLNQPAINPPQITSIEKLAPEEVIKQLNENLEKPLKDAWDEMNPEERLQAIAYSDMVQPRSRFHRALRSARLQMARVIAGKPPRKVSKEKVPTAFTAPAFTAPASSKAPFPFTLTGDQRAILEKEPSCNYSEALQILKELNTNFDESFPIGNDPATIERRQNAVNLGNALRRWVNQNTTFVEDIKKSTSFELAEDFYKPDSRFRALTLELQKLIYQVHLCGKMKERFTSFGEDRCWRCGPTLRILTPVLKDDKPFGMQLPTMSLLQKLANAEDSESIGKMSLLSDEGKPVQQIQAGKVQQASGEGTDKSAEYQTSHLCEPAYGGTGLHKRCWNPAHLVAETAQQNALRKNCLGMIKLDGKLHNVCWHGTKVGDKTINRCLGQLQTDWTDWEVTDDQENFLALDESRKPPEQPEVLCFPIGTEAAPMAATTGTEVAGSDLFADSL